jgi:hypothetical protein
MSKHLDAGKAGLVIAAVVGGFHLCWTILVALAWAQPVIDFVFWIHFVKPLYVIEPFEVARAGMLVAMTAGMGFLMGSVSALVWNALHKA